GGAIRGSTRQQAAGAEATAPPQARDGRGRQGVLLMPTVGLLGRFNADCRALGIVGERDLALAIWLIGTSRLLDRPLGAIVRGRSSTGKSHVVSQVARLFPADHVIHATRMTPQALYHLPPGSLAHKFVVAGERSRMQDDCQADATAALRQLL